VPEVVEVVGMDRVAQVQDIIPADQSQVALVKTSVVATEVAEVVVAVAIWVVQVVVLDLEISVEFQAQMVQIWYLLEEAVPQPVPVLLLSYKALGNI
jgi:hypothetical protein